MEYNYDKCPECGYINKNRPDVCPSCGYDWASHREKLHKLQEAEWTKQAEEARVTALENAYGQAIDLLNEGSYKKARKAFMELGDFKDSAKFAEKCLDAIYQQLIENFNSNEFLKNLMTQAEPIDGFQCPFVQSCREKYHLDDFKKIKKTFKGYENYKQAREYIDCCDRAVTLFAEYESQEREYALYCEAVAAYNNKRYKAAMQDFLLLEGRWDSDAYIDKCKEAIYQQGVQAFNAGKYQTAIKEFQEVERYKDASGYICRAENESVRIKQAYTEKRNAEEEQQREKNLKDAKVYVLIHAMPAVLGVISGIILFFNKDQISIVSSFGWWCFGWIILALASLYISGVTIPDMLKDCKNIEYYKRTSKERRNRTVIIAIASIICAVVVFVGASKINFVPTECVSITATAKEDSASGRYYDTEITFELQNDSDVQVTYINGEMVFYNGETEVATYNVYFQGKYNSGESYKTTVEFSDENPALYDVSFENLKITYRITSMKFNGELEALEFDGKAIVIKELN